MHPPPLRRAAAALSLLLTSGCAGLLHSTAPPDQTYYLRPPAMPAGSSPATALPVGATSVRVAAPLADPGLDSTHVLLLESDHRASFFRGARWPATIPQLVGSLAVQVLRASGNWSSVEDSQSPFPAQYLLQITVRRFDADYTSGAAAPEVHVVLDCTLGSRAGREILSSFVVAGSAPATQNRLGEVVGAFEQANNIALAALSDQTIAAVRAAAAQNATSPAPSSSRQNQ
jgi:cholesterol transport system auxiliary component